MNILAINDTKGTSDFTTRKKVVNAILNLKRSYKKRVVITTFQERRLGDGLKHGKRQTMIRL